MKIYYVERTDEWSYDDYDAFVCYAETPEQAKKISPSEYYEWKEKEGGWCFVYHDNTFCRDDHSSWTQPDNLRVREIGESLTQEAKPGVILASFNAG